MESEFPKFDRILVQALSRTGHNSIILWISANSPDSCLLLQREDKPLVDDENAQSVIIIRSVYNWFASWITAFRKWNSDTTVATEASNRIALWKQQARDFLGETEHVPGAKFIIFDLWATHRNYRDAIATELGMTLEDKMAHNVSNAGGGSTWDSCLFDGRAHEMRVLRRWEKLADDKEYVQYMRDPELEELMQRIFGYGCPL